MMTPESASEISIYQHQQIEGKVDVSTPSPYIINFSETTGLGYFGSFSLLESFDLTWQHSASAPSMLGARWQFLGNSLRQAGAGHSMAVTAAFGGNVHEVDGSPTIEFEVGATDFALIHGYWFTPNWQIYESLGFYSTRFEGELKGGPGGNFKESGSFLMGSIGTALVFKPLKIQTEITYTKAEWDRQKSENYLSWALGLGYVF
jgi:hypothetical protein